MALTTIDPASSWFEIAEPAVITQLHRETVNGKELLAANKIFDKTSDHIAKLVNKTRLWRYPWCCYLIYTNGSGIKYFKYLWRSYGIKCKPTTVKNPRANAILKRVHQVLGQMLHTSVIDVAKSVTPNDLDVFLDNVAWAICSTNHTVLIASPGAAIFGQDMFFDISFVADWHKLENTGNH
jgi:hypothetical protein